VKISRRSVAPVFAYAVLFAGTFADTVRAQDDYWIADDVSLTNLRVSPGRLDGRAQITFSLENRSAEGILFRGLKVAGSSYSWIAASLGNGVITSLESIPVAPGEVLSIDGERLWIEVEGLGQNLKAGGMIKATVHFGTAAIPVDLTVDCKIQPSF
jgi:hypothetical protein